MLWSNEYTLSEELLQARLPLFPLFCYQKLLSGMGAKRLSSSVLCQHAGVPIISSARYDACRKIPDPEKISETAAKLNSSYELKNKKLM